MSKLFLALFVTAPLLGGCSESAAPVDAAAPVRSAASLAGTVQPAVSAAAVPVSFPEALQACAAGVDELNQIADQAGQLGSWSGYIQRVATRAIERRDAELADGTLNVDTAWIEGLAEEWRGTVATKVCGRPGTVEQAPATGAPRIQFSAAPPTLLDAGQLEWCGSRVTEVFRELQACVGRARNGR